MHRIKEAEIPIPVNPDCKRNSRGNANRSLQGFRKPLIKCFLTLFTRVIFNLSFRRFHSEGAKPVKQRPILKFRQRKVIKFAEFIVDVENYSITRIFADCCMGECTKEHFFVERIVDFMRRL